MAASTTVTTQPSPFGNAGSAPISTTSTTSSTPAPKYAPVVGEVFLRKSNHELLVITEVKADGMCKVVNSRAGLVRNLYSKPEQMTTPNICKNYTIFSAQGFHDYMAHLRRKSVLVDSIFCVENCDVVFIQEGNPENKIHSMRTVLMQGCDYFKNRFREEVWEKPKEQHVITISAEDFPYMQQMVNYIHCVPYKHQKEDFHELLRVADYYACSGLLKELIARIPQMLTVENLHHYIKFLDNAAIATPVFDFMANNWEEVRQKNFAAFAEMSTEQNAAFVSHAILVNSCSEACEEGERPQKKQRT